MKRTLKYALTAVLTAGIVLPAIAQDQFPDVPENHWAYEALGRMKKDGLLIGYPDGKFRGPRPATRYELAVAMHAVYLNLKGVTDGLDAQIKALNDKIAALSGKGTDTSDFVSKADFNALKDVVDALKNDVAGFKAYGDDIAALKKATDTFQKELSSLGVDVEAMKKDLGDLAGRVKKLEDRKPTVDISGDVNLWVGAGNSRDNALGLTVDGRVTGTTLPGNPALGGPAGLSRDLTVLHELGLTFAGSGGAGVDWRGTLVVNNMLGNAGDGFGNYSQVRPSQGLGYQEGESNIYLQNFEVHFNSSLAGLNFNANVGRIGYKVSPYIFQRINPTSYYDNARWSNGEYLVDGAKLGFGTGAVKIGVVAGKVGSQLSSQNVLLSPVVSGTAIGAGPLGQINVNRLLGVTIDTPLTAKGNLNLAYLWLDSNTVNGAVGADRLSVYGGSLGFNLSDALSLNGSFNKAVAQLGTTNVNDSDNKAFNVGLNYKASKLTLGADYHEVEANYLAPGDWGRLGILRNPTNVKGFTAKVGYTLSDKLSINARGEFLKGKADGFNSTFFDTNTKSTTVGVDLKYAFRPDTTFLVGFENTRFENVANSAVIGLAGITPEYRWITFGFHQNLSDAAKLILQYQISDIKNEFQLNGGNNGDFKGGFFTTQLSVKF